MNVEPGRRVPVVQDCSVPGLFQRLCISLLTHSMYKPTSIIDFCFQRPMKQAFLHDRNRVQHVTRKLFALCMDVVLLRKWQWMGTETHCISHCLGVSLALHYQGQSSKAESLAGAITWLVAGKSDLIEADNVLHFLFLLSSPRTGGNVVDTPQTASHQIYSYYPR